MGARRVLMVRPAAFGFNPEAARTNTFARAPGGALPGVAEAALREFDAYAEALARAGIEVTVLHDTCPPARPDAVFPNNWVSFHEGGLAVLYPLAVASRRAERRLDVPHARRVDLSALEGEGAFVEGTGSLVLDHRHRLAFAGLSPRTTEAGVAQACAAIGYSPRCFRASLDGAPPYHTNVYLAIGDGLVAWAPGVMPPGEFLDGRDAVELGDDQVRAFAGNLLQLEGVVAVSAAGWAALRPGQRTVVERHGVVVCPDLRTIEAVGGGSARCMLAEVFE